MFVLAEERDKRRNQRSKRRQSYLRMRMTGCPSLSRRQTEEPVEEELGPQCLLCEGNEGCSPTRQQLDAIAAKIAEELDAIERGVAEYGETQSDQGRILDIRVEGWGSVVIFAHIEQPLGSAKKERLRDKA